jgi:hypothetical protein
MAAMKTSKQTNKPNIVRKQKTTLCMQREQTSIACAKLQQTFRLRPWPYPTSKTTIIANSFILELKRSV